MSREEFISLFNRYIEGGIKFYKSFCIVACKGICAFIYYGEVKNISI